MEEVKSDRGRWCQYRRLNRNLSFVASTPPNLTSALCPTRLRQSTNIDLRIWSDATPSKYDCKFFPWHIRCDSKIQPTLLRSLENHLVTHVTQLSRRRSISEAAFWIDYEGCVRQHQLDLSTRRGDVHRQLTIRCLILGKVPSESHAWSVRKVGRRFKFPAAVGWSFYADTSLASLPLEARGLLL
jgi:hypothetical protein